MSDNRDSGTSGLLFLISIVVVGRFIWRFLAEAPWYQPPTSLGGVALQTLVTIVISVFISATVVEIINKLDERVRKSRKK